MPITSDQSMTVFSSRYQLLRRVARGGMADVYLARDVALDRPVALKVLFPEFAEDPSFVERFRREAKAAANLNHPNIVSVYDWGQEHGTYYIVMEYVEGRSLVDVLKSSGTLKPDRAAEIASEVAAALASAHQAGIVHRDVKLGNVMISDEGQVKVADFGIATALASRSSSALTKAGAVMGTATYLSPEQAQGKPLDGRSDLYSLGVVLYEIIVGRPPFAADTPTALAVKHIQEQPVSPRAMGVDIAESLNLIILKLLAKKPARRYPKASDLQADLSRYLSGAHRLTLSKDPPGGADTSKAAADDQRRDRTGTPSPATAALPRQPQHTAPVPRSAPRLPVPRHPNGQATPGAARARPAQPPAGSASRSGRAQSYPPDRRPPASGADGASPPHGQPVSYGPPPTYYFEALHPSDSWKRTALMFLGLAVLLAVLGYLVLQFYNQLGFGEGDEPPAVEETLVDVPDLGGLSILDAEARLREVGLGVVLEYRINTEVPENTVYDQVPPPGQRLERGETVTVTIGQPNTPLVPPVTGRNSIEARGLLENSGYVVIEVRETNQAETGIVVRQVPASNTELRAGEAVTITVSSGPGQVFVPDVRNMTTVEAFTRLAEAGFRVGERREPSETVEEGRVIDTEPSVGLPVNLQSEIIVLISSGLPLVAVPDVQGLLFDTAVLTLEREGLVVGLVTFDPVEPGSHDVSRILAQTPPPDYETPPGTVVDLIVGEPGEPGQPGEPSEPGEPGETGTDGAAAEQPA